MSLQHLFLALLFSLPTWACGSVAEQPVATNTEPAVTPAPRADSVADTTVPTPSADTLIQVFFPDENRVERFLADGRWGLLAADGSLVGQKPMGFYERGRDTISPDGLRRLDEALQAVDFFELPELLDDHLPQDPSQLQLPNGQGALNPRPVLVTARGPDGTFHTVRAYGDRRVLGSFGPLSPLMKALDREAWGGWRYE